MSPCDIELAAVHFWYPDAKMQFDLKIAAGTLTIVTGPSGSGKSTLLNLIAGFETARSGTIIIDGQDVTHLAPSRRAISMLFQDHNLFNHITVEDNVGLGLKPDLRLAAHEKMNVQSALIRVGLEGKGKRLPAQLSGGEQQRVALARILVQNRKILLLDEPFASLGPSLRAEMTKLLAELQREKHLTILAVTHHPLEWADVAHQFVFVSEGAIAASGPISGFVRTHSNTAIRNYLG